MDTALKLRQDFPLLQKQPDLVYLDNASTTQKPQRVLDAVTQFYTHDYANVHRGVYALAERATTLYEQARVEVAAFICAPKPQTVIFTRGTTESINLVAAAWAQHALQAGDEIALPESEHHANLLPWQQLQQEGIQLIYLPIKNDGTLDYTAVEKLITSRTKLITLSHSSHVMGVHHDVAAIVAIARNAGARVLLDAAQSVPHQMVDVTQLDVDFCAFSAHKMLGPTGIGALYIKEELHEQMHPYQTGGGMVHAVTRINAEWLKVPHRLEAGTPAIAQAIGFAAACRYVRDTINFPWLRNHEAQLCSLLIDGLSRIPGVTIIGPQEALRIDGHMVSFAIKGVHAHDIAAYLDTYGICVRAGHHCAQPLAHRLGLDASVRASFYVYNTEQEVERCVDALRKIR